MRNFKNDTYGILFFQFGDRYLLHKYIVLFLNSRFLRLIPSPVDCWILLRCSSSSLAGSHQLLDVRFFIVVPTSIWMDRCCQPSTGGHPVQLQILKWISTRSTSATTTTGQFFLLLEQLGTLLHSIHRLWPIQISTPTLNSTI